MPNQYSPAEFVARIRQAKPTLAGMDDAQLLAQWLQEFPDDAEHLNDPGGLYSGAQAPDIAALRPALPDGSPTPTHYPTQGGGMALNPDLANSMRSGATPPALFTTVPRVAGAIGGSVLGSVAGGLAGATGGPAGVAAGGIAGNRYGGALGAGLGEGIAQYFENSTGARDSYGPAEIALASALGGVMPGSPNGAGIGKLLLQRASEGAKFGVAGSLGHDLVAQPLDTAWQGGTDAGVDALTQTLQDPKALALRAVMAGGLGAGLGAAGGGIEAGANKFAAARAPVPAPPPPPVDLPPSLSTVTGTAWQPTASAPVSSARTGTTWPGMMRPGEPPNLAVPTRDVPQYVGESYVPGDFNPEALPGSGPVKSFGKLFGYEPPATPLYAERPPAFNLPAQAPSDEMANALAEQVKLGLAGMLGPEEMQALSYQLERFGTPEAAALAKKFSLATDATQATPLYMQGEPLKLVPPEANPTSRRLPPGARFVGGPEGVADQAVGGGSAAVPFREGAKPQEMAQKVTANAPVPATSKTFSIKDSIDNTLQKIASVTGLDKLSAGVNRDFIARANERKALTETYREALTEARTILTDPDIPESQRLKIVNNVRASRGLLPLSQNEAELIIDRARPKRGRSATPEGPALLSDAFGTGAAFQFLTKHPELAKRTLGAAIGGNVGYSLGETDEEKQRYALLGAAAGGALPGPSSRVIPKGSGAVQGKMGELVTAQARAGAKGFNLPTSLRDARARVQDYLIPLQGVDEKLAAKTGERIAGRKSAYQTARVMLGGVAGGKSLLGYNRYSQVQEAAQKAGLEADVIGYLNNRGMAHGLKNLSLKVGKLAGEGEGAEANRLLTRIREGLVMPKGYTAAELDVEQAGFLARLGPEKAKQVKDLAQQVFETNRQALKDAYEGDVISKEVYDSLVRRGIEYVPLQRQMEEHQGFLGRAASLSMGKQKVVQGLEGSERTTLNPLESSMMFYEEVQREVARNKAAKQIVENLKALSEAPDAPSGATGERVVAYYEKGVRRKVTVDPTIAAVMKGMDDEAGQHAFVQMLKLAKRGLQAGAVGANVAFSVPNVVRDFQALRRFLPGTKTYNPVDWAQTAGRWAQSVKERVQQAPSYQQALDEGAMMGTLQRVLVPKDFLLKRAPAYRKGLGIAVEKVEDFNNILEETTKLAGWKELKAKFPEMDDVERAFLTREYAGSPDFAVHGNSPWVKQGNLVVMFLNPAVQGIAQTIKATKANPTKAFALLVGATAGSVALKNWNDGYTDEDGTPSMNRVPDYDKQKNFVIMTPMVDEETGRHIYYKLPMSHAAQLFYNPIQSALEGQQGGTQAALDVVSNVLPTQVGLREGHVMEDLGRGVSASLNPLIRTPLETARNEDPFRDRPIESKAEQEASPTERYDATTSPLAVKVARTPLVKALGETPFFPNSPKKLEYVGKNIFGGAGEQVLAVVDAFLAGETTHLSKAIDPIKRRFVSTGRDVELEKMKDDLYTAYKAGRTATADISLNKKLRPEESNLTKVLETRLPTKALGEALQEPIEKLGQLTQMRTQIMRDKSLSEAERKQQLKELRELEALLVRSTHELLSMPLK